MWNPISHRNTVNSFLALNKGCYCRTGKRRWAFTDVVDATMKSLQCFSHAFLVLYFDDRSLRSYQASYLQYFC